MKKNINRYEPAQSRIKLGSENLEYRGRFAHYYQYVNTRHIVLVDMDGQIVYRELIKKLRNW